MLIAAASASEELVCREMRNRIATELVKARSKAVDDLSGQPCELRRQFKGKGGTTGGQEAISLPIGRCITRVGRRLHVWPSDLVSLSFGALLNL